MCVYTCTPIYSIFPKVSFIFILDHQLCAKLSFEFFASVVFTRMLARIYDV